MDVLSDILDLLQLRGSLYFRTAFSPPWSVAVPSLGRAARFHLAVQGACRVRVGSDAEVRLNAGDLILIPNGSAHVLEDFEANARTEAEPAPLERVLRDSGFAGEGVLVYGGEAQEDAATKLVCGHFTFAEGADHPLLRALPPYLLVTAERRARNPWLDELMRLIARQMFAEAPGMTASVIRLSEALFIEVVRSCADQDEALRGILTALGDPRIGRALGLMHHRMEQDWTLESLSREVGLSRSRFAEQFQTLMRCAPMGYLTDLRLDKAKALLATTSDPVQRIARQVGYHSPAAFSRAFANRYGHSPKGVRQAEVSA
ncbi:cupin domain-containing protein [Pelagibius sp.]|uniref:AraC family transcriptional regulator n=1 Tax=Pelagibius sp. TaxID=1931238 RepID=UPI003B5088CD